MSEPIEHINKSTYKTTARYVLFSVVLSALFFFLFSMSGSNGNDKSLPIESSSGEEQSLNSRTSASSSDAPSFDSYGRYIFRDFDETKPMANFLAGIGGFWGIPMWAFYVNRGQGITSFGIQNKDGPISKFLTAEKAYQQTPFTGFRTFVKGYRKSSSFKHMPFFPVTEFDEQKPSRNMLIGMNEMEIEEIDSTNSLRTSVLYFTPPDEDFPALVRSTTFANLDNRETLELDVLDGLAKLIPSGLNDWGLNNMGRTLEAWMNVS